MEISCDEIVGEEDGEDLDDGGAMQGGEDEERAERLKVSTCQTQEASGDLRETEVSQRE